MATVVNDPQGRKRVMFTDAHSRRRAVRLGKMSVRQAQTIADRVREIVIDQRQGRSHSDELLAWLGKALDDVLKRRFRKLDLIDLPDREEMQLEPFIDKVLSMLDVKPGTATFYGHTKRNLIQHLGAHRIVRTITRKNGDEWRLYLKSERLAGPTIARRVVAARTIFKHAVKWGLSGINPFDEVKTGRQTNKGRERFITREMIDLVIDECPDLDWKLIFALTRYGGLRCPSELAAMRWPDLDWQRGSMIVHSPKTEAHEGGEQRVVPMFPELRPLLLEAFNAAEEGEERILTKHKLNNAANLRTQAARIIKRAGLTPWPKTFQNLRASRETELSERFPMHVVCAWIGNSPRVARDYYLMMHDGFLKAAQGAALQQPESSSNDRKQERTESPQPVSVTQNAAEIAIGGSGFSGPDKIRTTGNSPKKSEDQSLKSAGGGAILRNSERRKPNLRRATKRIRRAIASAHRVLRRQAGEGM
jgi:integrase